MRRFAMVLAAAGVALIAAAAPAWAHVKIDPESAPKGSDAVLGFVVPNEMENANTTKVVVQFPTDHPIAEALIQPIPGWKAVATQVHVATAVQTDNGPVNSAVKDVTWTATEGKGILPGDFEEFRVSVGLPDDADSLAFPTIQSYSNGQTVNWVQITQAGAPEPDNPEPVLTLTNADSGTGTTPTSVPATTTSVSKNDVDSAKTIAIIGVVVGALGLIAAVGAIVMGRRRSASS